MENVNFEKFKCIRVGPILHIITCFARNYRCDFFLIFQPLCIGITLRRSCIMIAAFLSRLYGSVGALQDYYSLIRISLFSSWHCQNSPSSFSPQSYLIGEITHNKPRQPQTTPVEVKKNCQLEFSRPSKLSFLWPRRRPVRLQDFEQSKRDPKTFQTFALDGKKSIGGALKRKRR